MLLDILFAVAEGETKPTKIMSKSNLSWRRFIKKLNYLTTLGLIQVEQTNNCRRFYVTEDGRKVVRQTKKILVNLTQLTETGKGHWPFSA